MMASPVLVKRNARKPCSGQNIKVFVRCRPMNTQEKVARCLSLVECQSGRDIVVRERPQDKFTKTFSFDKVFAADSKQLDVYRCVAKPLVDEVLNGFNCTIFAYGQTGTGKTFTMEGERTLNCTSWQEDPLAGIIPRCVNHLFDELRIQKLEFTMRVSFLELYNEELFDLLSANDDLSRLRLYEDSSRKGSCIIHGLEEVLVRSKDDVYSVIEKGSAKRQTAATLMNAHSSRSHTVFTVTVHIKENTLDGDELLKTGKLHLVDLAGSENIGRSGAIDKRAREAGNINQSLLTLGRVITSLVEKAPHVPYRESKLTRLLQDALGGRTKTSIIATVSPASINLEETLSTLDYAHRAKNITNKPEVNQKLNKKELIGEYTEEIERLRLDLLAMREKNGVYLANENYQEMIQTMDQQAKEISEKITHIRTIEEELDKKTELFQETRELLEETSERLGNVTSQLTNTRHSLRQTQSLLHDTAIDRDEQKYLVSAHSKTEDLLLTHGQSLISVADTTTSHIDLLQDKIDRTRSVEAHNTEEGTVFSHSFSSQISSMQSTLNQLKSRHCQALSTLSSDNSAFVSSIKQSVSASISELTAVDNRVSSLVTNIKEMMDGSTSVSLSCCTQMTAAADAACSTESSRLQKWQKESVLKPLLTTVHELSQRRTSIMDTMKDSVYKKNQEWECISRKRHSDHAAHSERLEQQIQQQLQHFTDFTNQIMATNAVLEQSNEQDTQDMTRRVDAIITELVSLKAARTAQCSEATRHTQQSRAAAATALEKAQQDARQTVTDVKSEWSASASHCQSISEQQSALTEHITELHQQDATAGAAVSSECSVVCSEVQESTAATIACLTALAAQHTAAGEHLRTDMHKRTQELHATLQVGESKVHSSISGECQSVTDKMASLEQQSTHVADRLQVLATTHQCALDEQHTLLHDRQAELQHLLNGKMRKTVPTGSTPGRQDYQFKRSLTATSPHDRLLGKYRAANSARLAARVPLPSAPEHELDGSSFSSQDNDSALCSEHGDVSPEQFDSGVFVMPSAPPRISSHDDGASLIPGPRKHSTSAPVSRSTSASSLVEAKENRLPGVSTCSKKRVAEKLAPPNSADTRSRRALGSSN